MHRHVALSTDAVIQYAQAIPGLLPAEARLTVSEIGDGNMNFREDGHDRHLHEAVEPFCWTRRPSLPVWFPSSDTSLHRCRTHDSKMVHNTKGITEFAERLSYTSF